jgi:hypothetical protein
VFGDRRRRHAQIAGGGGEDRTLGDSDEDPHHLKAVHRRDRAIVSDRETV